MIATIKKVLIAAGLIVLILGVRSIGLLVVGDVTKATIEQVTILPSQNQGQSDTLGVRLTEYKIRLNYVFKDHEGQKAKGADTVTFMLSSVADVPAKGKKIDIVYLPMLPVINGYNHPVNMGGWGVLEFICGLACIILGFKIGGKPKKKSASNNK